MIDPPASSFFISFAISLLESLIRLKSYQEITQPTWDSLLFLTESSKEIARKFNLQSFHDKFQSMLTDISNSPRKESMQILTTFCENEDLLSIDYGIRFLIITLTKNSSIIKGKVRNYETMLSLLSEKLKINVYLAFQNKYKIMKSSQTSPLVCMYITSPNNFAVLYHRAAKYLDEKPDPVNIDPTIFPFTDTTNISQPLSENMSSVLDLLTFLANNTQSLPPLLQIQLKHKVEAAGRELPGVLSIVSLLNLAENQICTHNSTTVLTVCGKLHCKECLSGRDKCPCGYAIAFVELRKNSQFRSVSSDRGARSSSNSKGNIGTPRGKEKVVCGECRKPADLEDFCIVVCKDHKVCIRCRAKKVGKGANRCGQCMREYLPDEKSILLAVFDGLTNSIKDAKQ